MLIKPFKKWALYFFGPIAPMCRKKNYILVCTNSVTKWVENKSFPIAIKQVVVDLLYVDIFTQFGVPQEIVTDQGT